MVDINTYLCKYIVMQTQPIRTTIQIDPVLYRQVKIHMAEHGVTFRHMVETSMANWLADAKTTKLPRKSKENVRFAEYNMGKIKGSLRRKDLYEERLDSIAGQ